MRAQWINVQGSIYIRAEMVLLPIDGLKAIRFDLCRRGYVLDACWLEVPIEAIRDSYWADLEGRIDEELIHPFLQLMTQPGDDIDELDDKLSFIALTLVNDLMRNLLA
mgnify:CR=1 FL=1